MRKTCSSSMTKGASPRHHEVVERPACILFVSASHAPPSRAGGRQLTSCGRARRGSAPTQRCEQNAPLQNTRLSPWSPHCSVGDRRAPADLSGARRPRLHACGVGHVVPDQAPTPPTSDSRLARPPTVHPRQRARVAYAEGELGVAHAAAPRSSTTRRQGAAAQHNLGLTNSRRQCRGWRAAAAQNHAPSCTTRDGVRVRHARAARRRRRVCAVPARGNARTARRAHALAAPPRRCRRALATPWSRPEPPGGRMGGAVLNGNTRC